MTNAEIIAELQAEIARLRDELLAAKVKLSVQGHKNEALAKRSGELERTANLVATQATELCRQLRGGSMEHLKTTP